MKSLKFLSIVSLCQVFTGALTAQVIEDIYGVPNYMVPKTTIAPIIDGILDPIWHNVAEIPQTSMCNGDVSDDHADLWGFSRVMWDDSFLYLFLRTQDDINWTANANSWENDSWELFFDGDNSKGTAYDDVNDLNIRIGSEDLTNNQLDVTSYFNPEGMEFENRMADDGTGNYTLEMKIPLANLFIDPNADSQFGFQIHQNDADGGIRWYREACTKWWSDPNNYSWNNPSTFGTAMLWDREISEYMDIHKIATPPLIDGVRDEIWKILPVISMNSYDNGYELPYSDEDLYSWFQVAWDDNNLYGFFATVDDINFISNPNAWENDSWEIYFDGDNSKGLSYDGVNDIELRFHSQYSNDLSMIDGYSPFILEGIEYVNRMADDGTGSYTLEFKIPLDNIFIDPEYMTEIGFEAHQNDADGGPIARETVSKWWEETGDFSWNNPSTFGTAVLVDDAISPPIENHPWSINLNIQENERPQSNLVRSFGGDALATPGYDQGFDALLPPSPQSFYAYFEIDEFPNHLSRDIRSWTGPYDSSIVWTLKTVNADNQNITMFWNPSELPSQGSFKLLGDGIDMDMRSNYMVSFNGNQTLTIQYSSSVTVTYSFTQHGWYMVSLPVIPADGSVNSLFPTALGGVAYTWEPSTETYQPVSLMVPQKGYWLAIPSQTTSQVKVTGKALSQFTEHFNAQGWYMIGCPRGTTDFTNPNDSPDGMVLYPAYGWDVYSGNYNMTNQLTEKNAYWIAAWGSCSLTIGNNQGSLNKTDSQMKTEAFQTQYGKEPPGPPSIDWQTNPSTKLPDDFAVLQNYPNPFNPETRIGYQMPKAGMVQLIVFDMLGRPVKTLVNGFSEAGSFETVWDGRDERGNLLASGMYIVKMHGNNWKSQIKIVLMR